MPPTVLPVVSPVSFSAADTDELGELQRQLDLLDPVQARVKVLTERADLAAQAAPADAPVVYRGALYELQLGPRRNERTVLAKGKVFAWLKRSLGVETLVAMLDIPLAVIDKNMPASAQANLVASERSGYRARKIVALQPVALGKALGKAA